MDNQDSDDHTSIKLAVQLSRGKGGVSNQSSCEQDDIISIEENIGQSDFLVQETMLETATLSEYLVDCSKILLGGL